MEAFRKALEQVAAPVCESCTVEMGWTHSTLIPIEQAIRHVFTCPMCDRIAETKTPVKSSSD